MHWINQMFITIILESCILFQPLLSSFFSFMLLVNAGVMPFVKAHVSWMDDCQFICSPLCATYWVIIIIILLLVKSISHNTVWTVLISDLESAVLLLFSSWHLFSGQAACPWHHYWCWWCKVPPSVPCFPFDWSLKKLSSK